MFVFKVFYAYFMQNFKDKTQSVKFSIDPRPKVNVFSWLTDETSSSTTFANFLKKTEKRGNLNVEKVFWKKKTFNSLFSIKKAKYWTIKNCGDDF